MADVGVLTSGGSEDGGSEPKPFFNGVRNGDLKGLWSVLAASSRRRRFTCGVDIIPVAYDLEGCSLERCTVVAQP